jgi:hypothetical protein
MVRFGLRAFSYFGRVLFTELFCVLSGSLRHEHSFSRTSHFEHWRCTVPQNRRACRRLGCGRMVFASAAVSTDRGLMHNDAAGLTSNQPPFTGLRSMQPADENRAHRARPGPRADHCLPVRTVPIEGSGLGEPHRDWQRPSACRLRRSRESKFSTYIRAWPTRFRQAKPGQSAEQKHHDGAQGAQRTLCQMTSKSRPPTIPLS